MTKIKICGLMRPEDIAAVNAAKPDYCGFIIGFPKSHRNLTPERVQALRGTLDPAIPAVGVFVDAPIDTVAQLLLRGVIDIAQLHGTEDTRYILSLQSRTGRPVWKAFSIRSTRDIARAADSPADLLVLDNGCGTGEKFDWSLLKGFPRPYLLAGGLHPGNLPQAIAAVHPYGVDLSSGVETEKRKDREKIAAAVAAVRNAR